MFALGIAVGAISILGVVIFGFAIWLIYRS